MVCLHSHLTRFAPSRLTETLPPLALKNLPELVCVLLPEIPPLLQQRWTIRHLTTPIDEDLGVSYPGFLIPMEAPDPTPFTVNQPSFLHFNSASTPVLARVRQERQQISTTDVPSRRDGAVSWGFLWEFSRSVSQRESLLSLG